MTLTEFLEVIRGYTGFLDPDVQSDSYLTAFVRQAERKASDKLRIADMVQIDTATIYSSRVEVPPDWMSNDFVRGPDGKPLRYKPRQEFYDMTSSAGYFTMSGRFIVIGGTPDGVDGKEIELHYFGDVPPLTDDTMNPSWLADKYLEVLINATMSFASTAMSDNTIDWEGRFNGVTDTMNSNYIKSIGSGSGLSRRTGSFG